MSDSSSLAPPRASLGSVPSQYSGVSQSSATSSEADETSSSTTTSSSSGSRSSAGEFGLIVVVTNFSRIPLEPVRGQPLSVEAIPPGEMRRIKLLQEVRYIYTTASGKEQVFRMTPYIDDDEMARVHLDFESEDFKPYTIYGQYREGLPRVVTIRLRPNIPVATESLPDAEITRLVKKSYFDAGEVRKIWENFAPLCHPDQTMSQEKFLRLFPGLDNKQVLFSIFHAFDRLVTADSTINFEEYVMGLSTMTRGEPREKAQFAYDIFDLDNDGFIDRSEMIKISESVGTLMTLHGFTRRDFGEPRKIINNVFLKRGDKAGPSTPEVARRRGRLRPPTHVYIADESEDGAKKTESDFYHDRLDKTSFLELAMHEPDLLVCFGLYDLFQWMVIDRIEAERLDELKFQPQPTMTGYLHVTKRRTGPFKRFLEKFTTRRYFFQMKSGFLGYSKHPNDPLRRAVALQEAVVRGYYPDTKKFRVSDKAHDIILTADSEADALHWMYALRSHTQRPQRFRSFAPVRHDVDARWFVNAQDYYLQLIHVLRGVKQRLYIAGWHISPNLYLRRDLPDKDQFRLDNLIHEVAKRGVRVYLLMFDAPNVIGLQPRWAAKQFTRLHKNIHAVLHPTSLRYYLWSHHQKIVIADDQVAFLGGIDLCFMRFDNNRFKITDPDETEFPGQDYGNLYVQAEGDGPGYKNIDRLMNPRMPWHDIHVQVTGAPAFDATVNFLQRWNHALRSQGRTLNRPHALLPIHAVSPRVHTDPHAEQPNFDQDPHVITLLDQEKGYSVPAAQLIRSATGWSAGTAMPEQSIYKAYIMAIEQSEHYIFIENQFFISAISRASPKNRLLEAIFLRLCRAISDNERFRCIVVTPLYPGGAVSEGSNRFMLKYTYRSISRGGGSLLEQLHRKFPNVDLSNYVRFFTLRQKAIMENQILQESVYIHAKLMIVDDRRAIIGSANINDRSLLGTRDSESGVFIEGNDFPSVLGGHKTKVNEFCCTLRRQLWRDLMALDDEEMELIEDPTSEDAWEMLVETATENSQLYSAIFPAMPENITKIDQIVRAPVPLTADTKAKFDRIRGVLVDFPLDFLKDESMDIHTFEKEKIVPRVVFL